MPMQAWLHKRCYGVRVLKNAIKILGIAMVAGFTAGLLAGTTLPLT